MKKFDDADLIREYEEQRRLRIVAEKFGCSEETVRRALIRAGIRRTKNKGGSAETTQKRAKPSPPTDDELREIAIVYATAGASIRSVAATYHRRTETVKRAIVTYGNGLKAFSINAKKITDAQLAEEAKTMTCAEIAKRYGMSSERVFRRARKIGIKLKWDGTGGHYKERATFYGSATEYDETITLRKVAERDHGICQLCGQPVDWSAIDGGHVRRLYPSVDHIIPLSRGGTHTWENVQLAHMYCNAGKCNRIEMEEEE